jgi:hypothetical protein
MVRRHQRTRQDGKVSKPSFLDRVRRGLLFVLNPKAVGAPVARHAGRPVAGDRKFDVGADFAASLKSFLAHRGETSLPLGSVNLIGLDKIKERFGASWERIAERADRIARNTIERYLVKGDIYSCIKSAAYMILFAQLSDEKARVKCALIAQEIAHTLLGESGTDLLQVKAGVVLADGSFDLKEMRLDYQFLLSPSEANHIEVADDKEPKTATPSARASSASPPEDGQRTRAAPPPPANPVVQLRLVYQPMWDQSRNLVSTYLCVGQTSPADGKAAWLDAAAATRGNAVERARLDELVLPQALDDLDALLREKRVLLLAVPLHFETLAAVARRRRLAQLLRDRVRDAERKLLVIEIEDLPVGVPPGRLVELISPLRSSCRAVLLRLPLETQDFTTFKGCGAAAVGIDIAAYAGPESVLIQHMNRVARTANDKGGLRSYVLGANSTSLVAAAIGAGFGYIGGHVIAERVDHPRGLVEFSVADVYRPFVSSS